MKEEMLNMLKPGAKVQKKPLVPPQMTPKTPTPGEEATPQMRPSGNPFDGAAEEMMGQMGQEGEQAPTITINGEEYSDPMVAISTLLEMPGMKEKVTQMLAAENSEGTGEMNQE